MLAHATHYATAGWTLTNKTKTTARENVLVFFKTTQLYIYSTFSVTPKPP